MRSQKPRALRQRRPYRRPARSWREYLLTLLTPDEARRTMFATSEQAPDGRACVRIIGSDLYMVLERTPTPEQEALLKAALLGFEHGRLVLNGEVIRA